MPTPHDANFARIAALFAKDVGGVLGGMMGSNALTVGGKIFVMRTGDGKLVYKLPRATVEALIGTGHGRAWGPGGKRIMKEWVELDEVQADLVGLARQARVFVAVGKA